MRQANHLILNVWVNWFHVFRLELATSPVNAQICLFPAPLNAQGSGAPSGASRERREHIAPAWLEGLIDILSIPNFDYVDN